MAVERCQKVRFVIVTSWEVIGSAGAKPSCLARREPEREKVRTMVSGLEGETKVFNARVEGFAPKTLAPKSTS